LAAFMKKTDLSGKTFLHFTGNMWGIGAFYPDEKALSKIQTLKQRDKNGMILLLPDMAWFEENSIPVPHKLYTTMQQYFPGNLSLAFAVDNPVYQQLAINGKVAFRVPVDPLLREFIAQAGQAFVSSSINLSHLPAEQDLNKILKKYAHWFDFAILPDARTIP